jgi:hypothetical protein
MQVKKKKPTARPPVVEKDPIVYKIGYDRGHGDMGFVHCLDITSDPDNPNLLWLREGLAPDRAIKSGPFVNTYIYIIPTSRIIRLYEGELTHDDVYARSNKPKRYGDRKKKAE